MRNYNHDNTLNASVTTLCKLDFIYPPLELTRNLAWNSPANWLPNSSQSHIATDGQSISKSWCRAPSWAHDQIFITSLTLDGLDFEGRCL
jgi:hypothetical protein